MHYLVRWGTRQLHVPTPRVEICRVRLHVFVRRADTMRVEDELVRREEQAAVRALDALCTRAVITGRQKSAATAPGALVVNGECEIFRQSAMRIIYANIYTIMKSNTLLKSKIEPSNFR